MILSSVWSVDTSSVKPPSGFASLLLDSLFDGSFSTDFFFIILFFFSLFNGSNSGSFFHWGSGLFNNDFFNKRSSRLFNDGSSFYNDFFFNRGSSNNWGNFFNDFTNHFSWFFLKRDRDLFDNKSTSFGFNRSFSNDSERVFFGSVHRSRRVMRVAMVGRFVVSRSRVVNCRSWVVDRFGGRFVNRFGCRFVNRGRSRGGDGGRSGFVSRGRSRFVSRSMGFVCWFFGISSFAFVFDISNITIRTGRV